MGPRIPRCGGETLGGQGESEQPITRQANRGSYSATRPILDPCEVELVPWVMQPKGGWKKEI